MENQAQGAAGQKSGGGQFDTTQTGPQQECMNKWPLGKSGSAMDANGALVKSSAGNVTGGKKKSRKASKSTSKPTFSNYTGK